MPADKLIYQLKVTLDHSKPPIWRRILVTGNTTVGSLHDILQIIMGWDDGHLHMFTINKQEYRDSQADEFGEMGSKNEARYKLDQLRLREKNKFSYEYDFGDSWRHTILVEKILPVEKGVHYPVCVKGSRACPPEDVGGVWRYQYFLEAIADPENEEHEDFLEWVGDDFDPEAFDLDGINKDLRAFKPQRGRKTAPAELEEDEDFDFMPLLEEEQQEQKAFEEKLWAWARSLDPEQAEAFEDLPLRRDVNTFLEYLSKNRTTGTASTGNLPLKAVQAICAGFVDPPAMEEAVGNTTFKVRREDEVWPLMLVHTLADHSGLVTGGQSKVWSVTAGGGAFHQAPPPIQVVFLYSCWWAEIDWVIAFPVSGLAGGLPIGFKPEAQEALRKLPDQKNVPFERFADEIIAKKRAGVAKRGPGSCGIH